jgi:hypothetical protein
MILKIKKQITISSSAIFYLASCFLKALDLISANLLP